MEGEVTMENNADGNLRISAPGFIKAKARARHIHNLKLNGKARKAFWDLARCFDIGEQWDELTPVQKMMLEEYGTIKLLELIELYNRQISHSIHYRLREKTPEEEKEKEKEESDSNQSTNGTERNEPDKSTLYHIKLSSQSDFHGQSIILLRKRLQEIDSSPAWSLEAIIDELFISMMSFKVRFCIMNGHRKTNMMSDPKRLQWARECNRCNDGNGVLRRLYEEQARYKMRRIPIFRPPPVFVVYLKHLDDRLKQELSSLDRENRDFVMKEAISRLFEHIDSRCYLLSVKPLLQWRFEN
jgi:hypothetical protein